MRISTLCAVAFLVGAVSSLDASQPDAGRTFVPVDTSRVLDSPDPMPLEAERAFPHLAFERPLELTYADDGSGRLFVAEQKGVIRVFGNSPDVRETKVFLDIQDVVSREGNEEGLLGLAFHPKYGQNGQFFIYYSTKPRASVLSRLRVSRADRNRADRASEEVLMRIPQPFGNHNGGSIRFGPDGYLYVGLGDGGSAHDPFGHGQNIETLLGSILRIDVDRKDPGRNYAVPKDNPLSGYGGNVRQEIWAYGLRNVWRLSFDRETGRLWAADVGQNRYEEVNRIVRGGNYGWNIREGFHPFEPDAPQTGPELIEPVAEYFHSEGLSVTGGIVYRGRRLPEFRGAYFYADYASGQVWTVRADGKRATDGRKVARTGLAVSAFGEDRDGAMYLTAFDGGIYRLRRRAADIESLRAAFPRKLSQTGLFASTEDLKPVAGAIPYDVNVPLWSDGATKRRFIALPEKGRVRFHARAKWEFPVGTVLVKSFLLDTDQRRPSNPRRLETRLFVHTERGWRGYTYAWNDDQTDAHLLDGALTEPFRVETANGPIDRLWYFPSRADCMACHSKSADFVLGPNTRQMNRTHDDAGLGVNQIDRFDRLGVFAEHASFSPDKLEAYPVWASPRSASTETLARAYLDVNCAFCHAPGGVAGDKPDFRFHIPLASASLLRHRPGQGRLGPADSALIAPGLPERSELLYRVSTRGSRQMPPLASNVVDDEAIAVLRRWIEEMPRDEVQRGRR